MDHIVEGLIGIISAQASAKQIDLTSKIARDLPLIETDPGKLQQILYNLLSNAIKLWHRSNGQRLFDLTMPPQHL